MLVNKESSTEDLVKRKQEILAQTEAGSEEVHAINQILHVRNMKAIAEKRQKEFMAANNVSADDLA